MIPIMKNIFKKSNIKTVQYLHNVRIAHGLLKNKHSPLHVTKAYDHHDAGGIIGKNLPFKVGNKWHMTKLFVIFFGIGWWAPFLVVAWQLNK